MQHILTKAIVQGLRYEHGRMWWIGRLILCMAYLAVVTLYSVVCTLPVFYPVFALIVLLAPVLTC